jgi:hypothetical protein
MKMKMAAIGPLIDKCVLNKIKATGPEKCEE